MHRIESVEQSTFLGWRQFGDDGILIETGNNLGLQAKAFALEVCQGIGARDTIFANLVFLFAN